MAKTVNTTELTQGRVVRYVKRVLGLGARIVWPAMVIMVGDDGFVDLCVFSTMGTNVHTHVGRDDEGHEGTWHWPGALARLEGTKAAP